MEEGWQAMQTAAEEGRLDKLQAMYKAVSDLMPAQQRN
jgi:hypothetical protein